MNGPIKSGTTLSIIGTATTWVSYTFMAIACIVLLLAARLRWERNGSLLAVARLLGGGPGYTRVPAALAAMVVSVVAAGLALTSVWLLHRSFAAQIAAHVATTMPGITIAPLLRDHALATLATAAIIGLLAGSLTGDRASVRAAPALAIVAGLALGGAPVVDAKPAIRN